MLEGVEDHVHLINLKVLPALGNQLEDYNTVYRMALRCYTPLNTFPRMFSWRCTTIQNLEACRSSGTSHMAADTAMISEL
jgi:hypothetical protein